MAQFTFGDQMPGLIVAIAMGIPVVIWLLIMIHWMVDGDLDVRIGAASIFLAIAMLPLSIWAPPYVSAILCVTMVASIIFLPFARSFLSQQLHRQLDTQELEKAHASFGSRPDNIGAQFAIAQALYKHGLLGNAIAIAERAMGSLSTEVDPATNRSFRDLYYREGKLLERWKMQAQTTPDVNRQIKCPRCGFLNPPGNIACGGCQAPYLLDLARSGHANERTSTKLVLVWLVLAATLVLGSWAGNAFSGNQLLAVIGVLVGCAGIACALILRRKELA